MQIIEAAQLSRSDDGAFAELEGRPYGSGVSFILVSSDVPGVGPDLHQHPYPETFVVRSGQARFTIGDQQMIGVGGQIMVVPAFTPHKFEVLGPERLEMIDIHASDTFITEWLEGPRARRQVPLVKHKGD
jgi:mannose-6-phosphate isomerase-like protein (cupin superfamily)